MKSLASTPWYYALSCVIIFVCILISQPACNNPNASVDTVSTDENNLNKQQSKSPDLLKIKPKSHPAPTPQQQKLADAMQKAIISGRTTIVKQFLVKVPALANMPASNGLLPIFTVLDREWQDVVNDYDHANTMQMLKLLLKADADLLASSGQLIDDETCIFCPNEVTPLHYAVFIPSYDAIELLLKNGAPVRAFSKGGLLPIHFAAISGNTAAIRLLERYGANINSRDKEGKTPLHHAAAYGQVAAVESLLSLKANPNAADKTGTTPLHSIFENYLSVDENDLVHIVDILTKKGANPYLKNDANLSFLNIAEKLLQKHHRPNFNFFVENEMLVNEFSGNNMNDVAYILIDSETGEQYYIFKD